MFPSRLPLLLLLLALLFRALQPSLDQNVQHLVAPEANVLLLTAHPDDECLFFAPTVTALVASAHTRVFSLCLSVGDADGLGEVRREELERSLDVLGVEKTRRWVVDHPDLKDDITAYWDADTIAAVLEPYVVQNNITAILTFDAHGVSHHPNHKSLPRGALALLASHAAPTPTRPPPRLFTLLSHPLASKYTGPLAALLAKLDIATARGLERAGYAAAPPRDPAAPPRDPASPHDDPASPHDDPASPHDDPASPHDPPENAPAPRPAPRPLPVFVAGTPAYATALRAMRAHRSQRVWFRHLYVLCSRYMWVNEWVEVSGVEGVRG